MAFPQQAREMVSRFSPTILFVGTALLALTLLGKHPGRDLVGYAELEPIVIASTTDGRVAAITVQPGMTVRAGDVVATMDDSQIRAELEVFRAEQQRLKASAIAEEGDVQLLVTREESARDTARSELRTLTAEYNRQQGLVAGGLANANRLSELQVRMTTLKQQIEGYSRTIDQIQSQLGEGGSPEANQRLKVVERRIDWLELQQNDLVLRAPTNGRVSTVLRRTGEAVASFEPIVEIVDEYSDRVVVCLQETRGVRIAEHDRATLIPWNGSATIQGTVVAVGASIGQQSARCNTAGPLSGWGSQAFIQTDPGTQLTPGQRFSVSFTSPSTSFNAVAAQPQAPQIQSIEVPESLLEITRVEPSGLVWSETLQQYIVVSDDTGTETKSPRKPLLLSMSRDGYLETNKTLPIKGVAEVDDLESITVDSEGGYYVLASQSKSNKGKRRDARTLFLHLDGSMEVKGQVHLFALLQAMDESARDALGVKDLDALDIEGMTWHNGALYFGLKSPLNGNKATILRLNSPAEVFAKGALAEGQLVRFAELELPLGSGQPQTYGGIAELLFLPDGTLMLAANPIADNSKAPGALFTVAEPGHSAQATLLREFPNRRPEGIALSPKQDNVVIVFDRGAQNPEWLEVPWSRG
jgi:multidrug resistance efflux pump